MRRIALLAAVMGSGVWAQEGQEGQEGVRRVVLVELFTSQG